MVGTLEVFRSSDQTVGSMAFQRLSKVFKRSSGAPFFLIARLGVLQYSGRFPLLKCLSLPSGNLLFLTDMVSVNLSGALLDLPTKLVIEVVSYPGHVRK